MLSGLDGLGVVDLKSWIYLGGWNLLAVCYHNAGEIYFEYELFNSRVGISAKLLKTFFS